MREQIWGPLLHLRHQARALSDDALVTYYTQSPHDLRMLESRIEEVDRALVALRLALAAPRSRGEDPLADPEVEVQRTGS